jgi:hypothetical protein
MAPAELLEKKVGTRRLELLTSILRNVVSQQVNQSVTVLTNFTAGLKK